MIGNGLMMITERFFMVERLLLALWVGGLCAIGYIATPILFASLDDRQLAGMVAGKLFTAISWAGLGIGIILSVGTTMNEGVQWLRQWRAWALLLMLSIVIVMLFVLQPMMADLKAQGPLVPGSEIAVAFGRLHGISSGIYLLMSLLGLTLVALGLRRPPITASSKSECA